MSEPTNLEELAQGFDNIATRRKAKAQDLSIKHGGRGASFEDVVKITLEIGSLGGEAAALRLAAAAVRRLAAREGK